MRDEDDLLTTMSHELRTPLNAILGWVQLLRAGGVCGPEVERALEIIERNARVEAKAVDEAIDLARIAGGQLPLTRRDIRWSEGLRAAVAAHEGSARNRGVAIDVEADPELRVTGDAGRLAQIARGMIGCAVRRTAPGGTVRVRLVRSGQSAMLRVREDRVRDEQHAAGNGNGRTLVGDGRGLGVAVARGLLRLHGGSLDEEDGGRTLVARIPLAETPTRSTAVSAG